MCYLKADSKKSSFAKSKGCLEAAKEYGGKIVADMICVDNMGKRVAQLEAAGITDIAVHTGVDMQAAGRSLWMI